MDEKWSISGIHLFPTLQIYILAFLKPKLWSLHSVWKSPKIVPLEFSILAFFTNVCLIEIDYLVTLFWTQAKVFQWWRRLFLWFSNTVRVRHLLKNPWHRNNQRTLKQNIQFWSQKILDFYFLFLHKRQVLVIFDPIRNNLSYRLSLLGHKWCL